ncbi:MAG: FtsQ-type POTRA domain-containing protein [Anaerolineaceae bacterium]|nr:FtsQ-type POTRA domain-containing protein [Anaerolineaceae bacterium]
MADKNEMSRADQVRARRKIEPVQRKAIPRADAGTSRNASNVSRVVSRHNTYRSDSYTSSNRPRKQVYISTGTPGSELRLPSLPQIRWSWRWLSLALAIGMVVLLVLMWNSAMYKVNTVNLSGGIRVPAEEVKSILNVSGESIIHVKPTEVEEQILATFPDIKAAHVSVAMPNTLDVVIEERIPALLWMEGEDPLFWIDQDGYAFTVRGEANLPIRVYANTTPPYALGYLDSQTESDDETAEANSRLKPAIDPIFVLTVQRLNTIKPPDSPLLYDEHNGLGWTDPHGWQVYFGIKNEDIDMKLLEYENIVNAILDKNLQPVLISMEFLHAPFYRLEP